jgi:transcriptional regulator with XRE-family HTH domain
MEASSGKKGPPGTFGPKLRQERQRYHLSQEKLAEMVGCDVRSIRRWEQGKSVPDYENRHRLSKALDITLEDFNKLLQPEEKKVEEFVEGMGEEGIESNVIPIEDFKSAFLVEEGRDEKALESEVTEIVTKSSGSVHRDSEEEPANERVRQPQRRALLKWGGTGIAAILAGGGAFYWFTRTLSSASSVAPPPAQVSIFNGSQGAGIRDVEWSPLHDFIVYVDVNNLAQVITVFSNTNSPSQNNTLNALTPTSPAYSYSLGQVSRAVNCVTWSPDGTRLASPGVTNAMITIWNPQNRVNTHFAYTFGTPESIAWSNDGKTIAVCGAGGMVSTWNAATGQFLRMYAGHRGTVWRVAWSVDSTYLATAGADGVVCIWNTTLAEKGPLTYRGHSQAVFDVKWSPLSDTSIVSASSDQTVRIWNPMTGETKLLYERHNKSVQAAEWSSDGQYIASAGADALIRVWDATTGKDYVAYHDHTGTIWSLSWSSFGMDLASGSADGTMRVRFVNI